MTDSVKKYKGARLECMLAYNRVLKNSIPNYIEHLFSLGVKESDYYKSYFYGDNFGDPLLSMNYLGYKNLLVNNYKFKALKYLIFNLKYKFYDINVDFVFSVNFQYNVIVLSTSEGFMRGFDLKKPIDKNRIKAYLKLCSDFCRKFPPEYSSVTDEAFTSSEFNVLQLFNKPEYKYNSETSFDVEELEALYLYYRDFG